MFSALMTCSLAEMFSSFPRQCLHAAGLRSC